MKGSTHGNRLLQVADGETSLTYTSKDFKERSTTNLEFGQAMTRSAEPNAITVFNIIDLLAKNLQQKDAPEAYMMYALYDADSNLYAHGKQTLSKNAADKHEILQENLYIAQDGHMEAFLVNETEEDVWPACRRQVR